VLVADIAVDARSGGTEAVWTYKLNGPAKEGDAFFVPLGSRAVIGFAVRVYEASEGSLEFPLRQLRSVLDKVEGLALPEPVLELTRFVSEQYLCPLSACLSAAAPPGVRDRLVTAWRLTDDRPEIPLSPLQQETVRAMQEAGGFLFEKQGKKLPASTQRALKLLRAKAVVEQRLQLQPVSEKRQSAELLRLPLDSERVETFLKKEGKRRPAQALTLMRLQTADPTPLTPAEIKALSGVTDSTLKAMVEAGLLERVEQASMLPKTPPMPNPQQQAAIEQIVSAIDAHEYKPFLLYGVTGSGKTEVFLRAAAEALRQGRQVLYLVPEIALAAQAIAQLRERFGNNVAVLHSELTSKERLENWMRVREGGAPVVLGARSALFAPLSNIGLIVIDEEHESSYKQESSPRYHSKRLAHYLAMRHKAALVLGSATPSVETYNDAEEGRLTLLTLPERAASAVLPTVYIHDLTADYKVGQPAILSEDLVGRIARTLDKGQQAILFLNRRAYSPFLICRDCGHQFRCPRCAVSLAFSRTNRRLRCHHCGFNQAPPDLCPSCRGHKLNPFGVGTEKVEEAVSLTFPGVAVARLDRDVAKKKGALEETLARFRSGDVKVLVGTQMVAKGLDFPNVTLVGVIAADTSLNIPDFRSSERTFQLLSQVAGRAGRGVSPGEVLIQTFNPEHVAVVCAKTHDFLSFYRATRQEREEALYPPFTRLVNLVFSGEDLEQVRSASDEAGRMLQELPDAMVLGPVECAIERIQGRWRRHILVKLPLDAHVQEIGTLLKEQQHKNVLLTIDVDPYSLV
jgi:primosomal protein N' (replication factor Y)